MTPKDTGDFLGKLKAVGEIPKEKILIPADIAGIYPSIPHDGDLEVLWKQIHGLKMDSIVISNSNMRRLKKKLFFWI